MKNLFNEHPLHKVLSLLVYLIYILITIIFSPDAIIHMIVFLFIPMLLIWFGDECGNFLGVLRLRVISQTSAPGWFFRLIGWIFLFLPVIICIISIFTL